jgi:dihydrofolate reductase
MKRPRIKGYAVISKEGMIATSDGLFPEEIKVPADHTFYMDAVARASAVANGAHSAEGGPHEKDRRRLRLTRRITKLMPDPRNTNVLLWNPATAPFDEAWAHLRIDGGSLAVVGGTDVFGLFLGIGYDAFFLSRTQASVPRGRPVFPGVGKDGTTPADIMGHFDLVLRDTRMLDPASNTYVEEWGPKA